MGRKRLRIQGIVRGRFASPVICLTLAGLTFFLPSANAAAAQAGIAAVTWPQISFVQRAVGLTQPVQVTHAGDGSGTLYVVEQGGRIRTLKNGTIGTVPFLDISARVLAGGEQGLLGVAFPPGFATKGYFYVNYTRDPDGATVIARYRVTQDPDVADPSSEEVLLVINQPFSNHNGGQIAFGPNGFLYIGMGDGGGGGDPQGNAQNPATLLGKMLRIDVEGGAFPYAVPPGNPFVGTGGFRGEIWALGLRNPWRFSFDRETGDLYIGDVGQGSFEEVDFQPASSTGGENYGWNVLEGNSCLGGTACNPLDFVPPVAVYDHSQGCSITGGTVYRGGAYPGMEGIYFYADICSGRVWGLSRDGSAWENSLLLTVPFSVSSFGEDEAGNLLATDYNGGAVYEIISQPKVSLDFDGDGKTDIAVFRPGNGSWYVSRSSDGGMTGYPWGTQGDVPVPGDYDGDGITDYAVWRPSDGNWYIVRSSDGGMTVYPWGTQGDVPVPGDFDGDGKTDYAVWRPSDGNWYIVKSSDGGMTGYQWGIQGDTHVPRDYDGDGKTDLAIWRPETSTWWVLRSSDGGITGTQWGSSALNDVPTPGDYDGDGKTDLAVWRPGDGTWYILRSSDGGMPAIQWGSNSLNDVLVPGDYDGDGKTDAAVWRPGDGTWWIFRSSDGGISGTQWGSSALNDVPIK